MTDTNKKYSRNTKKAPKGGEIVAAVSDNIARIQPVQAQPLEVKVHGNNFDKALRAFRALVQKERILSSYKEKQAYEKPSDKRRRKRNEAKRKLLETCHKSSCSNPQHHHKRFSRRSAFSE